MTDDFIIPDSIEPVYAWRVWRVGIGVGKGHLFSVYTPDRWEPREAHHAACHAFTYAAPRVPMVSRTRGVDLTPTHDAPLEGCSCGIYASTDLDFARRLAARLAGNVVGMVAMWGKVIEYNRGFRAEYAYPVSLEVKADRVQSSAIAPKLEELYGVPVTRRGA